MGNSYIQNLGGLHFNLILCRSGVKRLNYLIIFFTINIERAQWNRNMIPGMSVMNKTVHFYCTGCLWRIKNDRLLLFSKDFFFLQKKVFLFSIKIQEWDKATFFVHRRHFFASTCAPNETNSLKKLNCNLQAY